MFNNGLLSNQNASEIAALWNWFYRLFAAVIDIPNEFIQINLNKGFKLRETLDECILWPEMRVINAVNTHIMDNTYCGFLGLVRP